MCVAVVSGIDNGNRSVSYWLIFPCPEVFAKASRPRSRLVFKAVNSPFTRYKNSFLAQRSRGIKQKKYIIHYRASRSLANEPSNAYKENCFGKLTARTPLLAARWRRVPPSRSTLYIRPSDESIFSSAMRKERISLSWRMEQGRIELVKVVWAGRSYKILEGLHESIRLSIISKILMICQLPSKTSCSARRLLVWPVFDK